MQTESRRRLRSVRASRAFSLIEIMIVIAIIALIGGLVGFALFARLDEAQVDIARVQMNTIDDALKDFRRRYNRFPTEDEGLSVLWSSSNLEDPEAEDSWTPTLDEPIANDPWGNAWVYTRDTGFASEGEGGSASMSYELVSWGPDGEEDTEDDIKLSSGGSGEEDDLEFDFDMGDGGAG